LPALSCIVALKASKHESEKFSRLQTSLATQPRNVPDSAANSDSDDDDDGAMVGERHSNTRGLQAEAGLQHIAHVFVPVRAVSSERDHAMSNHPSSFNRCATCHRKSTCDPVNCELHEHVRKRNKDGELCSSPDPSRCSA